ncbi:hypothetical protein KZZ52_33210 [Dactylosporangium sp. AC04546]|uniref:hypothetical protein n=1 Tax=Dactylosporangium sp. AC04546 TaxID=2862460 RepID=UPI001EDEB7D9|nr:hypothetical protein [Dactylosporangium sp. AC04546]WVK78842.1 hypothetical protein KZZ52_33210 [Dactylosporangium sp. AC04546]
MNAPGNLKAGEADELLADLDAVHGRVAVALFAVDNHPALAALRGAGLTGRTAELAGDLPDRVRNLWALFATLGTGLDQARAARGADRLAELTALLRLPGIGLGRDGLPAEGAGVAPASRVSLLDLADDLDRRSAAAARDLSEVDDAWSAVAARIAPIDAALDAAASLAAELGAVGGIEPMQRRLAAIRQRELGDPLTAAPGGRLAPGAVARLDELEALVAQAATGLADVARVRETYPSRLAGLHERLSELADAESATAGVYAIVLAKIAAPDLPPVPAAAPVLAVRAARLGELAGSGRWLRLAADLTTVEEAVAGAQERAGRLQSTASGLLNRRDELRGRLDAYQAKAARAGLTEHDGLAEQYRQARGLLYTAPCDLRGSTRAVHGYQTVLAELLQQRPPAVRGEAEGA